jgi:hypothetical protein
MNMGRYSSILLFIALLLTACNKNDDPDTSGTATINNELTLDPKLQTYIGYGFLFSEGKLVSNIDVPSPDIIVYRDGSTISLEANNLKNSFSKYGEYADQASAKDAFNKLTSASASQWLASAVPLKENQVWLYRSGTDKYAKIRIISIKTEIRGTFEYAECTFEWVYQPDGTLTFPGK